MKTPDATVSQLSEAFCATLTPAQLAMYNRLEQAEFDHWFAKRHEMVGVVASRSLGSPQRSALWWRATSADSNRTARHCMRQMRRSRQGPPVLLSTASASIRPALRFSRNPRAPVLNCRREANCGALPGDYLADGHRDRVSGHGGTGGWYEYHMVEDADDPTTLVNKQGWRPAPRLWGGTSPANPRFRIP